MRNKPLQVDLQVRLPVSSYLEQSQSILFPDLGEAANMVDVVFVSFCRFRHSTALFAMPALSRSSHYSFCVVGS
jgi:hypothetical protein